MDGRKSLLSYSYCASESSVANMGLTKILSPLDATLTKNRGYHPSSQMRSWHPEWCYGRPYLSSPAPSSVPYFATSLLHCFQKRRRPFRSDGGICEKGAPSSGEKIVCCALVVRRRRRKRYPLKFLLAMLAHSALLNGKVGGHCKERWSRLRPLNVRQRVSRLADPRIGPLAHDHHLQIVGEPRLVHDEDRLLISDLAGRNRARQARSLCANSANHLGAQIFLFQIAGSAFFLLAGLPFLLELAAFHQPFPSAMRMAHLFRHFGIGMQHEIRLRHWIVNHYERFRFAGSRQRTKPRQRYFLANSPLTVAEDIRLRLSRDVVSVRERLTGFRHRDSAERPAR